MPNGKFEVGNFTMPASTTGNQDISLSDFGGTTPKAVIFMPSNNSADGANTEAKWGMGWMTADDNYSGGIMAEHNVGTTNTLRWLSGESAMRQYSQSGAWDWYFSKGGTPFAADQFSINIDDASALDQRIGYMAIGGSDISVKAGHFTTGTGSSKSVTGVGFQPDVVIFAFARDTDSISSATSVNNTIRSSFGFSDGTNDYVMAAFSQDGQANPNGIKRIAEKCIMDLAGDGSVDGAATVSSMDADGFTLDIDVNFNDNFYVAYLAIKYDGGGIALGDFNSRTSLGDIVESGLGFDPGALFLINGGGQTGYATTRNNNVMWGGLTSGTSNQWSSGYIDDKRTGNTRCRTINDDGLSLIRWDANDPQALISKIALKSFDTGGFTMEQTDADLGAYKNMYIAFEVGEKLGIPDLRGNLKGNLIGRFE